VRTRNGAPFAVRYPGRRNHGPGPDFLDAILLTAGGEVRGAVEVHRRTSDWERHGHGGDPRYAAVVLHVVGQDDGQPAPGPAGRQLPLLEIGAQPERWPWPDGPLPVPAFPCAVASQRGRDPLPVLRAAGERRFETAADRLGSAANELGGRRAGGGETSRRAGRGARGGAWEQVAYEAVAGALGYERNVAPMRTLAAALPLRRVRHHRGGGDAGLRHEALFLGSAGLLPSQRHLPAARRAGAQAEALERAWRELGLQQALRAYSWEHGGRPENAPLRRVLALSRLARRWPQEGLVAAVAGALGVGEPGEKGEQGGDTGDRAASLAAARRLAALLLLPSPADYWRGHWDFGLPDPGGQTGSLLGPSRAADVVVNVLLPLAAASTASTATPTGSAARAVYLAHPALAENWITRLVRQRAGLAPPREAAPQQGLIEIYERTCRDLRCSECPLAQAPP
jgi:hypothetical protein